MGWRALGVLLLVAAVGVGAGIALGFQQRPSVATDGAAEPVPAESPSVPVDPPPSVAPDPDYPPMPTELRTHEELVGDDAFGVVVPVPNGWEKFQVGPAELRWTPPDNPDHTYSVRVENVFSQRLAIEQIMDDRIESLSTLPGYTLEQRNSDTVIFKLRRRVQPRAAADAALDIPTCHRHGRGRDQQSSAARWTARACATCSRSSPTSARLPD